MTGCNFARLAVHMARRRRLARSEDGVALIEFALVFPLLISLFLGMVEFSEAFAVSRKLSNAAATVSDLVAQMPSVTTNDLNDIAQVAETLMAPYGANNLGLVITSVEANADNTATTAGWSYVHGTGASARTGGSAVTLPTGLTEPNASVILAETTYQFRPTIGLYLTGVITLRGQAYFRPRSVEMVMKTD